MKRGYNAFTIRAVANIYRLSYSHVQRKSKAGFTSTCCAVAGRLQAKWIKGSGKTVKRFMDGESFQGVGPGDRIEEGGVSWKPWRNRCFGELEVEESVGVSTGPFSKEALA